MNRWRLATAVASVGITAAVGLVAVAFAPGTLQVYLSIFALVAVALTLPGVFVEPRDLTWPLLFSLPPVVALVSEGSPTWLIAPLAALLLVAAELNALSWASEGPDPDDWIRSRRLKRIGILGGAGLVAAACVLALAGVRWMTGTWAVLLSAAAIAGIGALVFRDGGVPPEG